MYLCVRGTNFASFCDLYFLFWNYFYTVVFLFFILLHYLGTVNVKYLINHMNAETLTNGWMK